ncbi:MAG: hypothetical protein WCO49_10525 [Nostocales cyanobacterium ELA608]
MILARSSELDSGEMPKGKVVSKFLIKVGQLALYASKTDPNIPSFNIWILILFLPSFRDIFPLNIVGSFGF